MRRWAATAGRLLLAAVWLAAGALKIPDPAEGIRAVRAYRLLPEAVVRRRNDYVRRPQLQISDVSDVQRRGS